MSALDFFLLISSPFVGSFVSASAMQWPSASGVLQMRSHCDHCKKPLPVFDLIPIFSFLRLGGKCRFCQAHIHIIHPLAEIISFLIALSAVLVFQGWLQLVSATLGWVLLYGALVDIRLRILPDLVTLGLLAAGPVVLWAASGDQWLLLSVLGATIGFGVFYIIAKAYRFFRGQEGLGMGDAKLLAAAGAWTGPMALSWIVFLAGIFALCSLLFMSWVQHKKPTANTALSFGPALALAMFILWMFSGRNGVTINLL